MPRKNIKLPEPLFMALRDDKPDHMSWPTYFETECLGDGGDAVDYAEIETRVERAVENALPEGRR